MVSLNSPMFGNRLACVNVVLIVETGVPREDVARVAAALLESNDTRGWFDLLEGDDSIEEAIDNVVKSEHNGLEGEDIQRIWARET